MIRKFSMVAAIALVALTSSVSIRVAEAHSAGWYGGWGWGPGWGYYNVWGPRYYSNYAPRSYYYGSGYYYAPRGYYYGSNYAPRYYWP